MAVVVEYTPPTMTKAQYEQIMVKLGEAGALGNPSGVVHMCYGPDGHLRVLDVWQSEEAFRGFAEVLFPIIGDVLGAEGMAHTVSPVESLLLAPLPHP